MFVYLGIALFTFTHQWDIGLILCMLPILLFSRLCNIVPISFVLNLKRKDDHKITRNEQIMLWFSGLRGAMAFALSIEVPSDNPRVFLTTTLIMAIVTILVFGGLTISMLGWLNIRMNVVEDETEPRKKTEDEVAYLKKSGWMSIDRTYLKPFFTRSIPKQNKHGAPAEANTMEMLPVAASSNFEPSDDLNINVRLDSESDSNEL